MALDDPSIRRQFMVQKDDGSRWLMRYTDKGVRWVPDPAGAAGQAVSPGAPAPRTPNPRVGPPTVMAVLDAGAQLAQVWEMRQQRLLQQSFYEDRRLQWLDEMIGRWGRVHMEFDGIDFSVSEYLAREARETMKALVANRKWALPQSTLHDLSLIRDVFRATREQLLDQFEAFEADHGLGLTDLINSVLPGKTLNMAFVRGIAADPGVEWERLVADKETAKFDAELQQVLRSTDAFIGRLFSTTEIATLPPQDPRNPGVAELIQKWFSDLAVLLPRPEEVDWRGDAWERRDAFRELLLLPAEIDRVRTLTSAWRAVSSVIEQATPRSLTVAVGGPRVQLALEGATGVLGSETAPNTENRPETRP